jgi:serine/threonine-protein kinase
MWANEQQMIGQMLGPYQLEAVLGRGGMGSVYLARQTHPARHVAVKVLQLQPEMGDRSTVLMRFQREANTVAMLEHIHIIQIFGYGELAQMAYLVMPYISGGSLRDVLQRQGKLPLDQALSYLQQAASALDYAHTHGVIHRDLKPSNFLLYPDGRLVLADFGIARLLEGGELSSYVTLSTPNSTIGTPSYMAPEMVCGEPIDTRVDVYSLGIVFFQMLSGQVPFRGPDALSVLYKHINEPLPSLRTVDPALPAGIDAILQKATAKRPEDRYASAGDMVRELQSALQRGDMTFMPQTPYAPDVAPTYIHPRSQQQGPAQQPEVSLPVATPVTPEKLSSSGTPDTPAVYNTEQSSSPSYPPVLSDQPGGSGLQSPPYAQQLPYGMYSPVSPPEYHYSQQYRPSAAISAGTAPGERRNRPLNTLLKVLPLVVLIITVVFVGLRIGGVFASSLNNLFPSGPTPLVAPTDTAISSPTPTDTAIPSPTPSAVEAAKQVVTRYYDDINQRDYQHAYNLLAPDFQQSLSYSTFENGYSSTIHEDVTFNSVSQNGDGSVSVSTLLYTHEHTDGGSTYNVYQWNAKLIQINGAWRIESAQQSKMA